ncbi:hypothetical protein FACS1894188_01240 [Clostridia bacterium]|nr:hypothetical protein FACS1894188_01240 [Clostridia bacterium]
MFFLKHNRKRFVAFLLAFVFAFSFFVNSYGYVAAIKIGAKLAKPIIKNAGSIFTGAEVAESLLGPVSNAPAYEFDDYAVEPGLEVDDDFAVLQNYFLVAKESALTFVDVIADAWRGSPWYSPDLPNFSAPYSDVVFASDAQRTRFIALASSFSVDSIPLFVQYLITTGSTASLIIGFDNPIVTILDNGRYRIHGRCFRVSATGTSIWDNGVYEYTPTSIRFFTYALNPPATSYEDDWRQPISVANPSSYVLIPKERDKKPVIVAPSIVNPDGSFTFPDGAVLDPTGEIPSDILKDVVFNPSLPVPVNPTLPVNPAIPFDPAIPINPAIPVIPDGITLPDTESKGFVQNITYPITYVLSLIGNAFLSFWQWLQELLESWHTAFVGFVEWFKELFVFDQALFESKFAGYKSEFSAKFERFNLAPLVDDFGNIPDNGDSGEDVYLFGISMNEYGTNYWRSAGGSWDVAKTKFRPVICGFLDILLVFYSADHVVFLIRGSRLFGHTPSPNSRKRH